MFHDGSTALTIKSLGDAIDQQPVKDFSIIIIDLSQSLSNISAELKT